MGLLLIGPIIPIFGQRLNFKHIATEQGMTSVSSWSCTIDKFGFIWLASIDGILRYDGKKIKYYRNEEYPELPADNNDYVYCDSRNQIWSCSQKGLVKIDENRVFKRQAIIDSLQNIDVDAVFESGDGRIFALTALGAFAQTPGDTSWIRQFWWDTIKEGRRWRNITSLDKDRISLVLPGKGVFIINPVKQKLEALIPIKDAFSAVRFDQESLLVGCSGSFRLYRVFLERPDSLISIPPPVEFGPGYKHAHINLITRAIDGSVYMATEASGLVVLDSTLSKYTIYKHDPLNPNSLSSNSLTHIYTDTTGLMIINSLDGANYTNILHNATEYFNYLKTNDGQVINERVVSATEDHRGRLWICFHTNVVLYDQKTGESDVIKIPPQLSLKNVGISPTWVECDRAGRIWVALKDEGVLVYDANDNLNQLISYPSTPGSIKAINRPRVIKEGYDGYMYIGTESGLVRVHQKTFEIDTFVDQPGLRPLLSKRIVDILPQKNDIWISTSPRGAAWHYNYATNELKSYSINEGLPTNRIYSLSDGRDGKIFIGSFEGFSVLDPAGQIENSIQGDGLIAKRVEAIETAQDGSVWIANSYNLIKYDPVQKSFARLGSNNGMSQMNFVVMSSAALPSGKIIFGANKGFLLIDPDEIRFRRDSMSLHVFYRDYEKREIEWTGDDEFVFKYGKGHPHFFFTVSDIMMSDQILYKYRLSDASGGAWSEPSFNSSVDFVLNTGKYALDVMAFDGAEWITLPTPVSLTVRPPWWNQIWFIALMISLVIGILFYYLYSRIKKFKRELSISRQMSDLESRALRAQMNPHFVFNSLNAIQECIVTQRIDDAYTYLSKFSRLLRLVLEHSDMSDVSLNDELEVLNLYITLEQLRFKNEIDYIIELDEDLDPEEIRIPPMLIQPHLENAIWHGLRHHDGPKLLKLGIHEIEKGYLKVCVEDNGIGRNKSAELKLKQLAGSRHNSKGRALSENRMKLLKENFPETFFETVDLYSAQGHASGTLIKLIIPILNHHNAHVH